MLPPSALSPMTRYRVDEPDGGSGLRIVGRILLWALVGIVMVAVAFIAGLYLWFHQSVAAVQAHTKDAKEAQAVPRRAAGARATPRSRS